MYKRQDLAYASNSAKFATPGVNIGLFCSTPMVAISRNLSNKHSMEMLLTGELISSDKAAKIGLINDVIEIDELKDFVLDRAQKISKKSLSDLLKDEIDRSNLSLKTKIFKMGYQNELGAGNVKR